MDKDQYDILVDRIISNDMTMVTKERFDTIYRHYNAVSRLSGDIIECGIWRGGVSIFLAKLFNDKNVWMCDSFEGFQPLDSASYEYYGHESHTPRFVLPGQTPGSPEGFYEEVIQNLASFELYPDDRIKILKGWVKDTLSANTFTAKDISLLRIDVDAYSATYEVLEQLYSKVVTGGLIVFDDSCLHETRDAMCDFFDKLNIKGFLRHTVTDEIIHTPRDIELPCGCYIVK
jgi:O-methyltransferase